MEWYLLIGFALLAEIGIAIHVSRELSGKRIPVLIYHRLVAREAILRAQDRSETGTIVFDDEFAAHIRGLKAAGFEGISVEEFVAFHEDNAELPAKPVLVTFDDGWRSVYEFALPTLQAEQFKATVFVNTDPDNANFRAGAPVDGSMTPEMIRECEASGIEIGSHGVTHRYFTTLDEAGLRTELVESKRDLEELLGHPVRILAAPGGQSDKRVRRLAAEAGYVALFGGGTGTVGKDSPLLNLRRQGVDRNTSPATLVRNVRPVSVLQHRFIRSLKLLPTRLLGPALSNKVRRAIVRAGLGRILSVSFLKRAIPLAIIAVGLAGLFCYAKWIEPNSIHVEDVTLSVPGLDPDLQDLEIVYFADLHVDELGKREERLLRRLREIDPDLVLIGGDLMMNAYWMEDYLDHAAAACSLLAQIPSRHGKFLVWGNNDETTDVVRRLVIGAGVTAIENDWVRLDLPEGELTLVGLGDPVTGREDWERTFSEPPPEPIVMMAHSPDAFPEAVRRGVPVLLCGHTHGGQVRHPFVSSNTERFLRLAPGTPAYRAGLYSKGSSLLYVTRGVGMTHLRYRFLCPPEITRIRLVPR